MQKLTISNEELKRHRQYFYEHAVVNLEQLKDKIRESKWSSRKQRKLLSLCLYYRRQLAIGKPYQLRKIQNIIDRKYGDVLLKDKVFKEELEKAFGYKGFSCADIAEETVEEAKKKCGETNYGSKKILKQLCVDLRKSDKKLEKIFLDKLKEANGGKTKEDIIDIVSQTFITGVMEGGISVEFLPEWSPYLMQFNRKIRTCPYCNRQYITPFYSETGKVRADMDHFYPKSRYPHFSMSIYNLVPCCKFCNSSLKGRKEFKLEVKTPYEISIDDMAEFQYLPGDRREVRFSYKDETTIHCYNEMFKIEELYNFHSNVAANIKEMSDRYPPERIKEIVERGLISEKELYQLIVGNVSKKDEILEEPLNKLKRDVVKDIFGERVLDMITE